MSSQMIEMIGAVVGGGVFASLATYLLGNRKQDASEFSTLLTEYKGIVKELRLDVDRLMVDLETIKNDVIKKDKEIVTLRNQLMIFESSHSDVPVPIWLKDTEGKMLFLNSEYETTILHPLNKVSDDYIGNTDDAVFPADVAKLFKKHDKTILRKKTPLRFIEHWYDADGHKYEGEVIKYPRFLNKSTVIGIGGIIVGIKKIEKM